WIENPALGGFGDRHTLRIFIRGGIDLEILHVAIGDCEADGVGFLPAGDGCSKDRGQEPAAAQCATRGGIALASRERAQYACRGPAHRSSVLSVVDIDGPGAAAYRNSGNRR